MKVLLLLLLACLIVSGTTPAALTPSEKNGKSIYLLGKSSAGGDIRATLAGGTELPGSAMACVNCHGYDGKGRAEGGETPSDLRWQVLSKPYAVQTASGRTRPPYTEQSLADAITRGMDPSGEILSPAMPRYRLGARDLRDLTAYIRRLGSEPNPGVSDTVVRVGLLPPVGGDPELISGLTGLTRNLLSSGSGPGTIFGRRIEVEIAGPDQIANPSLFALLAPVLPESLSTVRRSAEEGQIPLLVGASLSAQNSGRYAFHLFPGATDQMVALTSYFGAYVSKSAHWKLAVLHDADPENAFVLQAVSEQCPQAGCTLVQQLPLDRSGNLTGSADAVIYLGPAAQFAPALNRSRIRRGTAILALGSVVSGQITALARDFGGRVLLGFPSAPGHQTPEGTAAFQQAVAQAGLKRQHLPARIAAFALARVAIEALRRTGRDLTREKFVDTLEGFYEFDTGMTPPVTFGPESRIGSSGAYIVEADPQSGYFRPLLKWQPVELPQGVRTGRSDP